MGFGMDLSLGFWSIWIKDFNPFVPSGYPLSHRKKRKAKSHTPIVCRRSSPGENPLIECMYQSYAIRNIKVIN